MNAETVVQEAWTAEEVQRLLQVQPPPPQADALENPFVRAAALLSHFSPNELHPIDELDGARRLRGRDGERKRAGEREQQKTDATHADVRIRRDRRAAWPAAA